MNEFMNEATENFKETEKAISELSLGDVIGAYDVINCLRIGVKPKTDIEEVVTALEKVIARCETGIKCPFCGELLFKSDLPQYNYVCFNCDENFYSCEVKEN